MESTNEKIARFNRICMDIQAICTLQRFVRLELSAENLAFVLAVRDLNPALPPSAVRVVPPECNTDMKMAKYIFDRFIPLQGRQSINLSFDTRQKLINVEENVELDHSSFDTAHNETVELIVADTLRRFLLKYPTMRDI